MITVSLQVTLLENAKSNSGSISEFSSETTSDSTINLYNGLMPETTNSTRALEKRGNVDPTTQEYQQWQKEQ